MFIKSKSGPVLNSGNLFTLAPETFCLNTQIFIFFFMNPIILLECILMLVVLGQCCHVDTALSIYSFKTCFILESSVELVLVSVLFL